MADLGLRPLTLGEVLDRTFFLYRRNFFLFVGITAIPQLLVLALQLGEMLFAASGMSRRAALAPGIGVLAVVGFILGLVVYVVAYLFAQGGTVYAVSDLYLGRATSIGASLKRMRGQVGMLFGVVLLNGLIVGVGTILLIIPGIYLACRLITCVPASLLENLGPRDSLERSYGLTRDNAGRAFVIYLLYFALLYGAIVLVSLPSLFGLALAAKNAAMMPLWLGLNQVANFIAAVVVTPILTIATAVFYYDLRVRKEAFDLQMLMNPTGNIATGTAGVPSMLR
jgi:hypothetical protein